VVRLVLFSDTHGWHRDVEIPPGDILIHAGDITRRGELSILRDFDAFLGELPHRHKLVIAGNHDRCFEHSPVIAEQQLTHATYLFDRAIELEGLVFYGSPWQPEFMSWAFNLPRGEPLQEKWALIPADVDVLITHGPPRGIGDRCVHGDEVGCDDLLDRVQEIRPRVHVFGHIHEAAGQWERDGTVFVNACTPLGEGRAVVLELEPSRR
jgi:Icc-related predicted phosphoesterase